MSMFWLPKIQNVFNVVPALACNGITQPYWETNFVYPISNPENPPATYTVTTTKSATTTSASNTSATSTNSAACSPGSFGLGFGDGYGGYCCKTEQDCLDNCLGGSCTGPANPVATTVGNTANASIVKTTTAKTTIARATTAKTTTAKTTIAKTTIAKATTTKTITVNATTTAATGSCVAGSNAKKQGDGKTGYCCTTSDDCLAVCRGTVCGV